MFPTKPCGPAGPQNGPCEHTRPDLREAPALPHSPVTNSPPCSVSSEVGHLVLLGHRAPFTLSTHLSLSKVLGYSCLEHGNAKSGEGLLCLCPLHPSPPCRALLPEAPPLPLTPGVGPGKPGCSMAQPDCSEAGLDLLMWQGAEVGRGCQAPNPVLMAEPRLFPVSLFLP